MLRDPHVVRLLDTLVRAVEVSLHAGEAARAVVEEIVRGAETGVFFAGEAPVRGGEEASLTEQDQEFLRSFSIRPEPRG